jgi:hypothetical protein
MDEQEWMELAAKAAGLYVCRDASVIGVTEFGIDLWVKEEKFGTYRAWNPLDDDGDAFRLAMSLDMTVNCNRDSLTVIVQSWRPKLCKAVRGNENNEDVRRAIVEVAAMIGKLL